MAATQVAAAHVLLIAGFHILDPKCRPTRATCDLGDDAGANDGGACPLQTLAVTLRMLVVAFMCVAVSFYARMFARVLHRAMFTFLRHRQAMLYIAALLDGDTASRCRLPFIDLTDVAMYPTSIFAWTELRYVLVNMVLHTRSRRATLTIGVATLVLVVACIVGVVIVIASTDVRQNDCTLAYYIIIMDIITLAVYLYQILRHADSVNKAQQHHYQKVNARLSHMLHSAT